MNGYAALLRGINVGGNFIVPMSELKVMFESLGYKDVKTLLNSGNVCFWATESDSQLVATKIETALEKTFSRRIPTLVRSQAEISALITNDPFGNIEVTKETRLYVTFLNDQPASLDIPATIDPNFQILRVTASEVCSVLTVHPGSQTTELMSVLEKIYGKNVTTRNWNTVLKIQNLLMLR